MARRDSYQIAAFAAFVVLSGLFLVGGFVGLGASSYWIDELFTLYVVDHSGGWQEVLRRGLTDAHPPGFYLLAHAWIRSVGDSEVATRALNAGLLAASLPVLFFGLRGELSLMARGFVVALAAGSRAYFEQSQNFRSYALTVLLAAGLLAIVLILRRQGLERRFQIWTWLGFLVVSLSASFVHYYLFLAVGAMHLVLLASAQTLRDRLLVLASGVVIATTLATYVGAMMSASEMATGVTWFSNSPAELLRQAVSGVMQAWSWGGSLAVALLALVVVAAPRNPGDDRLRLAGVCATVIVITLLSGLVVSFVVAPSFGKRNLIVVGPFFWALAGCVFDLAMSSRISAAAARTLLAVVVVLVASNLLVLRYRPLPRQEDWRGSAAYVGARPSCARAPIPVLLPPTFGAASPFFRSLAQVDFYGRYDARPDRLVTFTLSELSPKRVPPQLAALWAQRSAGDGCPVLAWAAHVSNWRGLSASSLTGDIAAIAGTPASEISVRAFPRYEIGALGAATLVPTAYVFERTASAAPRSRR